MSSIIISADDFGKSKTANKNILELIKAKRLQRVSVFVDREPVTPNQIKAFKDSKIKVDLHLDPHLREDDNFSTFYRIGHFLFSYITGKTSQIQADWENQITGFMKIFGKAPDGLNSHEHVHFFPPYLKIALKLCKKYEIKYIRFGKKGVKGNNVIAWILNFLNRIGRKRISSSGLKTSDFLVLDISSSGNSKETSEIICHPERESEFKLFL